MLFNPPAPDLPEPPLFDLYADTLEQVFSVRHDLHAFIALAEIGFARQAGRKVNESLFTAETLQMSWEAFFDDPFDEVEEQATRAEIFAEEVATQNASERSAYGDSARVACGQSLLPGSWPKSSPTPSSNIQKRKRLPRYL